MTSVVYRHNENSHHRRSRRSYYEHLASVHSNKKGVSNNLNCTIDKHLQHKVAATASYKLYNKFQSQSSDCYDDTYDLPYNSCKYDKKAYHKMSSSSSTDRNAWNSFASTTASDSDSNSSNNSSELNGFKIVQEGKVLHNEIEEELDSPSHKGTYSRDGLKFGDNFQKFASSVLVTGPNVKEISIPSFL